MRENQKDRWANTRMASTWAMSALLALQLTGTSLPAALAQEAANTSRSVESQAEVMEESKEVVQKNAGAAQQNQDASPQTEAPASEEGLKRAPCPRRKAPKARRP